MSGNGGEGGQARSCRPAPRRAAKWFLNILSSILSTRFNAVIGVCSGAEMRHAGLLLLALLISLNSACAIQGYSPSDPVSAPSTEVQNKVESLSFSYITSNSKALASADHLDSAAGRHAYKRVSNRWSNVIMVSSLDLDVGCHPML